VSGSYKTMITLIVGEKKARVKNNSCHSEVINDMLGDCGVSDADITVPDRYYDVVGNYINFMHSKPTEIKTVKKLVNCFEMNTFFIDNEYFKHLISQLFSRWSGGGRIYEDRRNSQPVGELLSSSLTTITTPTLLWEICLHLPFRFITDDFITKPSFVKEWMKIDDNKKVTLNGDEQFQTTIILNCQTPEICPHEYDYTDYLEHYIPNFDNIINQREPNISYEPDDVFSPYSFTTKLISRGIGMSEKRLHLFYRDYRIKQEFDYQDMHSEHINMTVVRKVKTGKERIWFDSGQLMKRLSNSSFNSTCLSEWYESGQIKYEKVTDTSGENCQYEYYHEDGTLLSKYSTLNGRMIGKRYYYNPQNYTYSYYCFEESTNEMLRFEIYDKDKKLLVSGGFNHRSKCKMGKWYVYRADVQQTLKGEYDWFANMSGKWILRNSKGETMGNCTYPINSENKKSIKYNKINKKFISFADQLFQSMLSFAKSLNT